MINVEDGKVKIMVDKEKTDDLMVELIAAAHGCYGALVGADIPKDIAIVIMKSAFRAAMNIIEIQGTSPFDEPGVIQKCTS